MVVHRFILAALLCVPLATSAQQPRDTVYARLIREYTSDPSFLPASIATIPEDVRVPSPRKHFGTIIGAPGVMHRTAEIYDYYRALAAATPRVRVEEIGRSEEGRLLILVQIADESLLADANRHREAAARLADPRRTSLAEAEALIAATKPSYYLSGGLHSPEMGSPEMLMELAYRLVVSEEPSIRAIRSNLITLINPVAEPDGRDRQVDWYYRYTRARTEWNDGFPRSVPFWGKYVYHDNNRDGIQISQALTRAFYRAFFDWHHVVGHDLHESVPLLYVSTGTGPYNETIDPVTIGEWQLFANHDMTALTAQGLPGVWTWGFYDGWYPGYALWITNNHNAVGRFYETFGNAGANTYVRDLSRERYAGEVVTSTQWYRPLPPTRKVRWSARDNVNFMQAGVLASLSFAANNGAMLLRNFYQKGVNSIERGRREKPHAFFIPERQRDPRRMAYLVNQLRRHGIEILRRAGADTARGYVIRLDQPYRNFAVSLLTKQNFPSDAPNPPYDDVAWTLGYMYGVDVRPINDAAVFRWAVTPFADTVVYSGSVTGTGSRWLVRYTGQSELLPGLYWLRQQAPRAKAFAVKERVIATGDTVAIGTVLLENLPSEVAARLASRYGFDLRFAGAAQYRVHELDLPRVAVYHFWNSTQDEGWVRFALDHLGIPYTSIDKDDARRGGLKSRFDVILVPNAGRSLGAMVHEYDRKFGPMPFTKTAQYQSHGVPLSTPDMTGGMGFEGLAELRRFVEAGGVLLTLRDASRLVSESGFVPAFGSLPLGQLFHPGSVVRVKARRNDHPVLYGYPETFHVFRGNGMLVSTERRDRGTIVLQYGTHRPCDEEEPTDDRPMLGIPAPPTPAAPAPRAAISDTLVAGDSATAGVPGAGEGVAAASADSDRACERNSRRTRDYQLSGMVRNAQVIIGQGVVLHSPLGRGHVVAYTFNPLHRYMNQHDFALVWNAMLNWNDLPAR
jgi:hypothetical protein